MPLYWALPLGLGCNNVPEDFECGVVEETISDINYNEVRVNKAYAWSPGLESVAKSAEEVKNIMRRYVDFGPRDEAIVIVNPGSGAYYAIVLEDVPIGGGRARGLRIVFGVGGQARIEVSSEGNLKIRVGGTEVTGRISFCCLLNRACVNTAVEEARVEAGEYVANVLKRLAAAIATLVNYASNEELMAYLARQCKPSMYSSKQDMYDDAIYTAVGLARILEKVEGGERAILEESLATISNPSNIVMGAWFTRPSGTGATKKLAA